MKTKILALLIISINVNALTLTIPSYPENSVISDVYTRYFDNISPQMIWSDVPAGTQSFAIVYFDERAGVNWLHWKHYNIDSSVRHMPENNPNNVGTSGQNSWGQFNYGGPQPPSAQNGEYRITLYALNTTFNSQPSVAQILAASIESDDWFASRNVNSSQARYEYMATYRLTFNAQWSSTSHPIDYPGGAHFSSLIGNTHKNNGQIWRPTTLASNGIENMAETGGTSSLNNEIVDIINTGGSESLVTGGGANAVDTVIVEFDISASHPLLSMVSMIAPSPDWFIGVHDLSLSNNGIWLNNLTVDLFAYDSGTDSGSSYTSGNNNTNPAEPISLITTGAFANGTPLGTFEFELLSTQGVGPIDHIYSSGFE